MPDIPTNNVELYLANIAGESNSLPEFPTNKVERYLQKIASKPDPTPEYITEAVDDWLDDHPEATTTVEDGSITETKLSSSLKADIFAESFSTVADKELTATAGVNIINSASKSTVNLAAGTDILFRLNDPSGIVSKYYLYLDGSSDYAGYVPNRTIPLTLAANTTEIGIYVDSSWISASGTVEFVVEKVAKNTGSVEARADSALSAVDEISDYVPTGISDGYVVGHVVTNGSFRGTGALTTYETNNIRTGMIPIRAGDKIVIENGGFQHECGMWEGEPSTQTNRRNDNTWITIDETIVAEYDGYLVIIFRLSSDANITPSDFDGAIKLYNTFAYRLSTDLEFAPLPSYYEANNYISGKAARINALGKAGDDVFFFITDVHWEQNAKHSPALIKYLSGQCKVARLFDGGDLANGVLPGAIKAYDSAFSGRIYRLCGNHDWFPPENGKSLYYWLNSDNYDQNGSAFNHYWYVDNVQQKIRYITLNSFKHTGDTASSGWEYGYDADQINWFANEALNVPNGYDVIVFAHWFRNKQGGFTGYAEIESAIASFNADTSDHGRVICIFQGHTHWDAVFHTSSGVPVITTTCDKYDLSNEPELSEEVRTLGTINEQAFDVCVLNREAKTITCVRIGALAQNNIDVGETDTGFTFAQTLEERVVSYE